MLAYHMPPTAEIERCLQRTPREMRDIVLELRSLILSVAPTVTERIQPMFKFKMLLEANLDELGLTITNECGKTYGEAVAEMRRGIENVEVACGAPILMQGRNNGDIAAGIDEHMIRQPLGVVAAITPFT